MTRVMKAGDQARQSTVRLFRNLSSPISDTQPADSKQSIESAEAPASPSTTTTRDADDHLRKQIVRLEMEVEQLRSQLEDASARAETREEASFEKGHAAGMREEREKDAERIALLESGLAVAQESLFKRQSDVEILALNIAETAMGKVLATGENHTELLAGTIAKQLERLQGQLVLAVHVSAEDFPDDAQINALKARFRKLSIVAKSELSSGECRMKLKVGQLDLGIPGQWARIQELFAQLADETVAAS